MSGFNLSDYIRPFDPEKDNALPMYSHSRLETFRNCPYQFDLKYNQGKVSDESTIALQIGSLFHLVLEHKGKMLVSEHKVDYEALNSILTDGAMSDDGKGHEFHVAGLTELKKKYFEVWKQPDSEGRNYDDKTENFLKVLHTEMEDNDGWKAAYFEHPFRYAWDNRIILHGFIDRIDTRINENGETEFRVVDYKTSKKIYDPAKNVTSWQFAIYNGAMLNEFGALASENLYRFICINESQTALTKGWESRFAKAMTKLLDKIDEGYKTGIWFTSSTPLCYWCSYNAMNPDAHAYKRECEYYLEWTPTNRVFTKHKEFDPTKKDEPKRKLVF